MVETKNALVTGISGMDGSHLAENLIEKGYEVYGLLRRSASGNTYRIQHLIDNESLNIIEGDIIDQQSLIEAVKISQPDEVYNLAAMSFVGTSWKQPVATANYTGISVLNMLEAVRQVKPDARFYQASTSELFGKVQETPQTENTPFYPRSPYANAKLFGHWSTINYRESYNMFACAGILFNHESERRGMEFVTRKITHNVAKIKLGLSEGFKLGNLDAKRDWGYAPEYTEMMRLMLQHDTPEEFVCATGETHTVRDFVNEAFKCIGVKDWSQYVGQDPRFMRPADVNLLIGDPTKAKQKLGWKPTVMFPELVKRMVDADIKLLQSGKEVQ